MSQIDLDYGQFLIDLPNDCLGCLIQQLIGDLEILLVFDALIQVFVLAIELVVLLSHQVVD